MAAKANEGVLRKRMQEAFIKEEEAKIARNAEVRQTPSSVAQSHPDCRNTPSWGLSWSEAFVTLGLLSV